MQPKISWIKQHFIQHFLSWLLLKSLGYSYLDEENYHQCIIIWYFEYTERGIFGLGDTRLYVGLLIGSGGGIENELGYNSL